MRNTILLLSTLIRLRASEQTPNSMTLNIVTTKELKSSDRLIVLGFMLMRLG
jgi:hypothetical protein